ncbi:DUF4124 domain-containing protein [Giesbergeria anulus]|uniref:DUF4124 domain-containing protein n=1 Tax=Giesbergeria anulus TaxID=180197 RepID=A0A1H9DN35_9BURK|nr:DUF4124 domain-containing protein [Giesbergeria anulus]SEQ14895.1 hypothetical protein SAMN02982919_00084 [Giesbergeria anulus]
MKKHHALLLALLCTLSSGAWAQWQWVDKEGRKVFSDRAPPIDIPDSSILKQPGGRSPAPTKPASSTEPSTERAAATPKPAAKAPAAGIDKELQARKAQADAAEAAKKKAEEEQAAKGKAENCTRARSAKTSFDSGQLLRHTNAQGESVFMDEATRKAELQRLQKIMDTDCKR